MEAVQCDWCQRFSFFWHSILGGRKGECTLCGHWEIDLDYLWDE